MFFLCTRRPLKQSLNTVYSTLGLAIASRYDQMGRLAGEYPPCRPVWYSLPYSVGVLQEVATLGCGRECRVLSRNSLLSAQSLNDIWRYELHIPPFADTNTPPSLPHQIAIFGGWGRWETLTDEDKGIQEDALWRSTPRMMWEVAITELFDHMADQLPGAPVAVATPAPTRKTGGRYRLEEEEREPYQGDATIPIPLIYYAPAPSVESGYREGGKQLAPAIQLHQSTSCNDNWLVPNESRQMQGVGEPWRAQSDSPLQPAGERIRGNRPPPATRRPSQAGVWRAVETYQMLRRWGMISRNWLRLEIKSDRWEADASRDNQPGSAAEESLPAGPPVPTWRISARSAGGIQGVVRTISGARRMGE